MMLTSKILCECSQVSLLMSNLLFLFPFLFSFASVPLPLLLFFSSLLYLLISALASLFPSFLCPSLLFFAPLVFSPLLSLSICFSSEYLFGGNIFLSQLYLLSVFLLPFRSASCLDSAIETPTHRRSKQRAHL